MGLAGDGYCRGRVPAIAEFLSAVALMSVVFRFISVGDALTVRPTRPGIPLGRSVRHATGLVAAVVVFPVHAIVYSM